MLPKGGMKNIMKKAQELQDKMEKAQQELNKIEIEGQSGGGMITAKVNGHKELITLNIDPEILTEDKEMIEDLIVAAVNQAIQNAGKTAEEKMNSITGGMAGKMKFPGM
ncbi:MAG: YbaB/EbfC family nucleoid-associated protein [Candidatus Neomarinimicrobiota bacterium]|nr:YbaB/EbfC family nucleoid-associated protein [Candidatus Neomarinimicrobiota bacterium]|tara:strand:+ start:468 stop:794 length:327 start_codon:yes stop_codon:yes gene_type:complete